MTLSRDSKYIIAGYQNGIIKIFDIETAALKYEIKDDQEKEIICLAVSRDNKLIISASNNKLKAIDMETKSQVHEFENMINQDIKSVTISSDNKWILVCGLFSSSMILDIETKQKVYDFRENNFNGHHIASASSITMSRDNGAIILALYDGTIRVIDAKHKVELDTLLNQDNEEKCLISISSLCLSGDNKYIFAVTFKSIVSIDRETQKQAFFFENSDGGEFYSLIKIHIYRACNAVKVSKDNKLMVVSYQNQGIKVFDFQSKKLLIDGFKEKDEHSRNKDTLGCTFSILISEDNKFIVWSGQHEAIIVYDLQKKEKFYQFEQDDKILSLTISNDNRYIVTGGYNGTITIYDLTTKSQVHHFQNIYWSITCFSFERFNVFKAPAMSVFISRDNKFLLSCSLGETIKVFDFQTKVLIHDYVRQKENGSPVNGLSMSKDGKSIISVSIDGTIRLLKFPHCDEKKLSLGMSQRLGINS